MEKDDEFTGVTGSHLNFGARIYDSRVGRFLSRDPKFSNYPDLSPYVFSGNNPILFIDKDGKDYSLYIDHENKTIIVKATIYTTEGDESSHAEAMHIAQFWNEQSDKFKYIVGKKDEAQTYSITFEIEVKVVDNPMEEMNNDRRDFVDDEEKNTPDASSNSLTIAETNDPDHQEETSYNRITGESTIQRLGGCREGKIMKVLEQDLNSNEGPHEMGHALGIPHSRKLMNANSYGSMKVIPKHIKGIIENAFFDEESATGSTFEDGERPADFTEGKVKRNKEGN
jgi:RHS repeat-associated protein